MNRYIALQKILESGSFTKAADTLGFTQSSVSQMISSLENELSMKLLTRSRHGVRLTLEGEELYPFIERTIYQYQSMLEKANGIKGLDTGVIRVGTISSITCHWMPQLIKGFQEQYPHVQFLFHQGDYTSISEWIRIGAVDFGFVSPSAVTNLNLETITDGEMLAVLPIAPPIYRTLAIAYKDKSSLPIASRYFIDYLKKNKNELP